MVSADRRKEMYACGSIDGRDSHGFSTQPRSVHMILDLSIIASSRLFTIFPSRFTLWAFGAVCPADGLASRVPALSAFPL